MLVHSTIGREKLGEATIATTGEAGVQHADVQPPVIKLRFGEHRAPDGIGAHLANAVVREDIPQGGQLVMVDPLQSLGPLVVLALAEDQVLADLRLSGDRGCAEEHLILEWINEGGSPIVQVKEHLRTVPELVLQETELSFVVIEAHLLVPQTVKAVKAHYRLLEWSPHRNMNG